jgi:hypothetical protein
VDFLGNSGLPVSVLSFSDTTPGALIYRANYAGLTESLAKGFSNLPKRNSTRATRIAFWIAGQGSLIRTNTLLAHVMASVQTRCSSCMWCQERPQTGWLTCLLCGEEFCSGVCFDAFHSVKGTLELLSMDETSDAGLPLDAPSNINWKTPLLKAQSRRQKSRPLQCSSSAASSTSLSATNGVSSLVDSATTSASDIAHTLQESSAATQNDKPMRQPQFSKPKRTLSDSLPASSKQGEERAKKVNKS